MTPDRKQIVNGYKVEEFWWAGSFVVYIDHKLTEETFEDVIERLKGVVKC